MFVSSQNQGILDAIKRERGRHSAIRSVVGHINTVSHLGRNYFKVAMATMPFATEVQWNNRQTGSQTCPD